MKESRQHVSDVMGERTIIGPNYKGEYTWRNPYDDAPMDWFRRGEYYSREINKAVEAHIKETQMTFKVGDRIRMTTDELSNKGETGVITDPYPVEDEYDWRVRLDKTGGWAVKKEWIELVTEEDEEARIDAALAKVKESRGLCREFDTAVNEAKRMPLLKRLETVAKDKNRTDLFDALQKESNTPKYVRPEIPSKGDYVRLTMADGTTKEGEVTEIKTNPYYFDESYAKKGQDKEHHIGLNGENTYAWIFEHQEYIDELKRPSWTVVKVEHIERPVEVHEIDGVFLVKRYDNVYTYKTREDAQKDRNAQTSASTPEAARKKILNHANFLALRGYIPALLATLTFFERNPDA